MPALPAAVQRSRTSECLFDKPQTGPRPVKHFDALEFGLNSTFRIKAGPGYHMHTLIAKKKKKGISSCKGRKNQTRRIHNYPERAFAEPPALAACSHRSCGTWTCCPRVWGEGGETCASQLPPLSCEPNNVVKGGITLSL